MFKSSTPLPVASGQDAIIGKNIKITGSIDSPDMVVLHGEVTGDIICKMLEIGSEGNLKGNVKAETVIISGSLSGDVETIRLKLEGTAHVNGEMRYQVIEVEEGAQLEGSFVQQKSVATTKGVSKAAGDEAAQ